MCHTDFVFARSVQNGWLYRKSYALDRLSSRDNDLCRKGHSLAAAETCETHVAVVVWGVCGEAGVERRGVANVPRVVRARPTEEMGKKRKENGASFFAFFFFFFYTR